MNLLSPVSTIMTTDLKTVSVNDSLVTVGEIFDRLPIHHLPVMEGDRLAGIISKTDFLLFRRGFFDNHAEEKYDHFRLRNHKARDIMTKGLGKLEPGDRINVALEIFKMNFLHALPVVENGKLVGMVTTHDIIKHLADDKSAVNEYDLK